MVANQKKRKLDGISILGSSSYEQSKANKKRLRSTHWNINASPHITLDWNERQNRVVAKREQIGLVRRDLASFNNCYPHSQNILADVCAIPSEIHELANLSNVLSNEVWQSVLSEKERKLLMQFLPKGVEVEQVVRSLLSGDNFHFGNPFLKWSASLCSGHLHPDSIIKNEKFLNAKKKSYYSELHKYHDDIVSNLRNYKVLWEDCKDHENDFLQNIWRSKKHVRKSFNSSKDFKKSNTKENTGDTSESYSDATDEKACSSDNQISPVAKSELPKRRYMDNKYQDSMDVSYDVLKKASRPSKKEKLNKRSDRSNDGSEYMSYVKISKKQLQLLKSMKQSGKSILSQSLNSVLGEIGSFNVRPYEAFEEEERTKLHDHWLQVVKRDLPVAFAQWRNVQSCRSQIIKSLGEEFKEKFESSMVEEEKGYGDIELHDEKINEEPEHESTLKNDEDFFPAFTTTIQPLNQSPNLNIIDVGPKENHAMTKDDGAIFDLSGYAAEDLNPVNITVNLGVPALSSSDDVWPTVDPTNSFYHPIPSHKYSSNSGLSLENPQIVVGNQTCLIDLESDLHKQLNNGEFSSYQNHEKRDFFQPFYPGQEILSYNNNAEKQTGLVGFQQDQLSPLQFLDQRLNLKTQNNRQFIEPARPLDHQMLKIQNDRRQFMEHPQPFDQILKRQNERQFIEQPQPLDHQMLLKRQSDYFPHSNIQGSPYSSNLREHNLPINIHDWPANPVRTPVQQPYLNGMDSINHQNWFSGHIPMDTTNACFPTQNIGNLNNNDGNTLFSALSTGPNDQFISSRNFDLMNRSVPMLPPQPSSNLGEYMGSVPGSQMTNNNMVWSSLPHQNSSMRDSSGKPFLRSWNQ